MTHDLVFCTDRRDRGTDRAADRCKKYTDRTDRGKGCQWLDPFIHGLYGLYSFYNGLYHGLYHGLYGLYKKQSHESSSVIISHRALLNRLSWGTQFTRFNNAR